ncbi:MAG: FAD-dependent thymidylate synthase [Nitrososphaerota archaeon]
MSNQSYTDEFELEVIDAAPSTTYHDLSIGPDEIIAIQGSGTFEKVSLKEKIKKLIEQDKNLKKFTKNVHWESTRRGHASLSTSAILFTETRNCSRLLTMLLVSSQFGSYLQESQRRSKVTRDRVLVPAELREKHLERFFIKSMNNCYDVYAWLIDRGIKLEDARYILPLSSSSSVFSAASLESFVYLFVKTSENIGIVPTELKQYTHKLKNLMDTYLPELTNARLSFSNLNTYYPLTDPLREPDKLIERIIQHKPSIGAKVIKIESIGNAEEIITKGTSQMLDAYNNFFRVITCEVISLAAYHQAVRHRTVSNIVEPLPEAILRVEKNLEEYLVIPPDIKRKEELTSRFLDAVNDLLTLYRKLVDENENVAALYAVPQAITVSVIRSYNLFNLVYPMGFIATRTCSKAQWEERSIAYKIWHDIEREMPWMSLIMGEKCKHLGYCPEKEWCPIILKYRQYSDEIHREYSKIFQTKT